MWEVGSFSLALNSNPLAGSLLLIACTAFLRSGWYHLLLLLPSTGKACKKSLSCARKSIPRALDGCCKNKTKSCPSLAQKIIFLIYMYIHTPIQGERGEKEPQKSHPSLQTNAGGSWFLLPAQGRAVSGWCGKNPYFYSCWGHFQRGLQLGAGGFSVVLVNKNGCGLKMPAPVAGRMEGQKQCLKG